ncbi:MAG: hypothetical protein EXQ85_01695 [Alphaproteobacteria bacterium]|nr:hypothetical protein [Alphaproteobacteria bacterium]
MIYVVHCADHAEGERRRREFARPHLSYVKRHRARYLVAGPCPADENNALWSSLLLIEADSLAAARNLMENDPYFKGGVWREMTIRPFRAVAGSWLPPGMEIDLADY